MQEEITAPIWEAPPFAGYGDSRGRGDELSSGLRPRPIAVAQAVAESPSSLPGWLDDALRDPAIVLAAASVLGLFATGLAATLGFLIGIIVA